MKPHRHTIKSLWSTMPNPARNITESEVAIAILSFFAEAPIGEALIHAFGGSPKRFHLKSAPST